MTDREWVNPAEQEPDEADAVVDGRPTPGEPGTWADDQGDRQADQQREVAGSQLEDGTRDDIELAN